MRLWVFVVRQWLLSIIFQGLWKDFEDFESLKINH
nr:MAG TPA: hypothetical protein [Caudoviricetes sp.]